MSNNKSIVTESIISETCKSLMKYIEIIDSLSSNDKNILVYRGHSKITYELKPSIGRINGYNLKLEKNLFLSFKSKYHSLSNLSLNRDMDVLCLAQHYGLPTRLLDWSYNPLIALYMTCCSNQDSDGVVIIKTICDKDTREEKSDKSPFEIEANILFSPDYWDIRFINQKGLFECFADPTQESSNIKAKITIPHGEKVQILKNLSYIGIDKNYVYPSLESLCSTIKEQFNI